VRPHCGCRSATSRPSRTGAQVGSGWAPTGHAGSPGTGRSAPAPVHGPARREWRRIPPPPGLSARREGAAVRAAARVPRTADDRPHIEFGQPAGSPTILSTRSRSARRRRNASRSPGFRGNPDLGLAMLPPNVELPWQLVGPPPQTDLEGLGKAFRPPGRRREWQAEARHRRLVPGRPESQSESKSQPESQSKSQSESEPDLTGAEDVGRADELARAAADRIPPVTAATPSVHGELSIERHPRRTRPPDPTWQQASRDGLPPVMPGNPDVRQSRHVPSGSRQDGRRVSG
jgi:hypothetical protein